MYRKRYSAENVSISSTTILDKDLNLNNISCIGADVITYQTDTNSIIIAPYMFFNITSNEV